MELYFVLSQLTQQSHPEPLRRRGGRRALEPAGAARRLRPAARRLPERAGARHGAAPRAPDPDDAREPPRRVFSRIGNARLGGASEPMTRITLGPEALGFRMPGTKTVSMLLATCSTKPRPSPPAARQEDQISTFGRGPASGDRSMPGTWPRHRVTSSMSFHQGSTRSRLSDRRCDDLPSLSRCLPADRHPEVAREI